jgi:hypothetical protein
MLRPLVQGCAFRVQHAGASAGVLADDLDQRRLELRLGKDAGGLPSVDGEEGEVSLRRLAAEHGPLPATVEVITGGGGRHIYPASA